MPKQISENKRNMILNGNLSQAILMLAVPVMINSFIQSMYNLTDTFWLGRIGTENQSAITLVSPFQNILNSFGSGITTAGAILISQYLGARKDEQANKMANHICITSLGFSLICALLCWLISPALVTWLGARGVVYEYGLTYLRIVVLDMPFLFMINLFTAVKQAQGDTVKPMLLNLLGIMINLILDPLFLIVFHFGIGGAAFATLIAKIPCALIGLILLTKSNQLIRISFKNFVFDQKMIRAIIKIGPMKAALREDIIRNIVHRKGFAAAEKELGYCRRNSISAIASTDPEFPALLREIPDYPHVLYLKGNAAALSARCVAMVGTRRATPYGQTMCNRLVEGLAAQVPGLCIVSGLAFGIDVAAHRAALAAGVRTVAVLANPLPGVMPAQHTAVARDILDHGGALVTELHSQTRQNGTAYLARNRIIAGLGAGCVVVESPDSGGSLATAHCADGYDRSVMAVPGRATDGMSSGTNHLIRNRKAQLVMTADDIVRELMWDLGPEPAAFREKPSTPELTPDEAGLLGCFRTDDPLAVETLAELSGLEPGELAALLVGLELAGAVRQLPGNRYMKTR